MQPDLFSVDEIIGSPPDALSPSEFVAIVNQTLEYAYPVVEIIGEVSGFNLNQGKFVFFDIKDDSTSVGCFMMAFALHVPLEDGMMVKITAQPKLTNKGRFSLTVRTVVPVGEGALSRAFELLKAKLQTEGLFDESRKRLIPRFPQRIGLISSETAAGAQDFLTIVDGRWRGVEILFAHVQVQGESAPAQIVSAIEHFNQLPHPVDVLVLVRGGGSLEDLMAFSTEPVARAVAGSRTPIVVGVGNEEDGSLADLAADVRAATPTHAAQLVVPDSADVARQLQTAQSVMTEGVRYMVSGRAERYKAALHEGMASILHSFELTTTSLARSLHAYDPKLALKRGYSVLRSKQTAKLITSVSSVSVNDTILIEVHDGRITGEVTDVQKS